jgi:hypothetical protein
MGNGELRPESLDLPIALGLAETDSRLLIYSSCFT